MLTRTDWETFQEGREEPAISDQLLTSWRRSRWSGVDPLHAEVSVVDVDTDSPYVRSAAPVLLRVADMLSGPACLALADAKGRVLWRWVSDGRIGRDLDTHHMAEGAAFSEESVGTNGIGTALESGAAAVVVGAAHFVEAFHAWACVAAPVTHPVTQRVQGAVNITCYETDANQFMRVMVQELADNVSRALLEDATVSERRLLDAYMRARRKHTAPVLAVNARTMIVDEVAGGWGLRHHDVWQMIRESPTEDGVVLSSGLFAKIQRLDDAAGAILTLYPNQNVQPVNTTPTPSGATSIGPLEQAEAGVITEALNACGGNKAAAAAYLGISRGTLYQRLRRYRIAAAPDTD